MNDTKKIFGVTLLLLASFSFVLATEIPDEYAEAFQEFDSLKAEYEALEEEWNSIQEQIDDLPEGSPLLGELTSELMALVMRGVEINARLAELEAEFPGITEMWENANNP